MLFEIMSKKVALVENFGLDFLNFRVPLAKFLQEKGFEVYAIIPEDEYSGYVKETGVNTLIYKLKKNTFNPLLFIGSVRKLKQYHKEQRFSIIHAFRLQPNIITSFAFAFSKDTCLINHITGLGFAFAGDGIKSFFYRVAILSLYQMSAFFTDRLIVQNSTDFKIISKLLFTKGKIFLIEGSGVDLEKFCRNRVDLKIVANFKAKLHFKPGDVIISFTGRLLIEKGIIEFLEVADILTRRIKGIKFVIAGWFDKNNPSCITAARLNEFLTNRNIIFLGLTLNIRELLYLTDIFVLPTYREGFPRSVLEAMAMNLAVITTCVPGARDTVINNFNGLLIPAKDNTGLEKAILELISDRELCMKMGENGRMLVENRYRSDLIYNKILNVYRNI